MRTKKFGVLPSVHDNAISKLPEHRFFPSLSCCDTYFVLRIQRGAIPWIKGESVIRPSEPSEALMPNAEMLEDPKFAT